MRTSSPYGGDGKDITILVPAYRCADQLAEHSRSLQRYRELGCPVIWVVSPSPDGSEGVAQEICKETGDRFLLSPPGLYESWNFGIQRIQTEFFGISTIGDFYINENLLAIVCLVKKLNADLCFTPPSRLDISRREAHAFTSWPVFIFEEKLKMFSGCVLPRSLTVSMQLHGGLSCLLGSWASIVARTATIQKMPFPVRYGHYGDTAWFYKNLLDLKVAYDHRPIARFQHHTPTQSENEVNNLAAYHWKELSVDLFRKSRCMGHRLSSSFNLYRKYFAALYLLNKARGLRPTKFWWLRPRCWVLRFLRNSRYRSFRDSGHIILFDHMNL